MWNNNNNRRRLQQMQRAAAHRDDVAPWEKYAREDDRIQGWICNHDHDPWECDD